MVFVKEKKGKIIQKALAQYEDLRDTIAVIEAMQYEKEKGIKGIPWETLKKKLDKPHRK